jgi:hypothetical protein
MKVLRSIKIIGMVMGMACASLAMQNNATAGTVQGALELLGSDGFSSEILDENTTRVAWRSGGQLVRALVTERPIGGTDSQNLTSDSTRISITFFIKGAEELVRPRVVNSINADALWIKFYIDNDGDGVIERLDIFREDDTSNEVLAAKIVAYLSEIEDTWTQVTTEGTA